MHFYHNSRNTDYREPFGAVQIASKVSLAIDVKETAPESIRLMVWQDENLSPAYYDMTDSGDGRYRASFETPSNGCLLWYAFEIATADGTIYYGNNKEQTGGEGSTYEYSPECYQITVYKPFDVPEWYKEGIVYQIFPDRFARDEDWHDRVQKANDGINSRREDIKRTVADDWMQKPSYSRNEEGRVTEWTMYGGSFKGIEQKLSYLRSLGVTAIYLNPIFEATSNHRYDTANYMKTDPALGSDEDFKSLAKTARELGIRLILDGVFSHTGCDSIYFDKFGNYPGADGKGAWDNTDSPYRSWFKFDDKEDCGYKSWWGVDDLPEVNENDEGYREYILGPDGVVAHWIKMGASGWRLDVADELPDSFIEETRSVIKKTDSDALLIGEVWEDASNKISYDEQRSYLLGDELDGTMNYPLRDILLDYINYTISSADAMRKIGSLEENYPRESFYGALNLIGSHDRERILSMMAAEEDLDSAVRKVKLLSALQYAMPGVPCIYYGDEAGLTGGKDPENRAAFPWGSENPELAYHYRMLGVMYDEHPALKGGSFKLLDSKNDDILAFTRTDGEETLLVLANRSYGESSFVLEDIDAEYALDLLSSRELPLDEEGVIKMDRLSCRIISLMSKEPKSQDFDRAAGVICHVSSIPGGKMGSSARDFVDYIASAGFKIWQVLPLNPAGTGNSPYSSHSTFAGEPAFIDYDELPDKAGFSAFVDQNAEWLSEYVAYTVTKESQDGRGWLEWPESLKNAKPAEVLAGFDEGQRKRASRLMREQYYFDAQWKALKEYANSKGVSVMGDLPMFMALESSDVWANKEIFKIDADGRQSVHAGVPPDVFSNEGQDWGNPLYDWDKLEESGYRWWLSRIRQCAQRYDMLRIDHFRGLSEYFAIPEGMEPDAGLWQHGPGLKLFKAIAEMLDSEGLTLKLLAEDLGYLDDAVMNLIKLAGLPGMDIWQFSAFDMMELSEREPKQAAKRAYYSGTHDNNTLVGWLQDTFREEGRSVEDELTRIIEELYRSPACLAMLQIQDVLMLGTEARMNVPGVPEGNWTWKLKEGRVEENYPNAKERAEWLKALAESCGR